ncbi:coiled-coil domain-containing protein 159 isoform X2 [Podarcis muralis]
MPFFRPRGRAPPQHGNQDSAPRRRIAMGGVCGCAKQQRHEGRRGHEGPRPFVTRREAVRGIPRAALRQLLSAPGRASGGRSGQSRAMDSREEVVLATTEPLLMPVSHNDMCRNLSPSWCLSRAGSPMPMHAQSQLEIATMKPTLMVPESQMVKNEVDLIKAQLYAQTKAFQALSHSITLLEQESNQQQGRIKELEEEVQFFARSPRGEMFDSFIQKRIQDVWKVMSREVQGLHGSMIEKESSMENLSQAVLESKKLLWEELEAVQGELRRIHQKLKDQEVEITRNMGSIKKMQANQLKCTKFLGQLKCRTAGDGLEAADNKPVTEELKNIWSAVNTLRNSFTNSNWSDKRGSQRMKGRGSQHQRKCSSPEAFLSDSALYQAHSSSENSS